MKKNEHNLLEFCFSKYVENEDKDINKLFFFIIYIISKILGLIFSEINLNNKQNEKKLFCTIVFSKNQLKVARILKEKGLSIDIYCLYNKVLVKKYLLYAIKSLGINKDILSWKKINKTTIFANNKKRIIKLILIKSIIELIIDRYDTVINFNDHSPNNLLLFYISKKHNKSVYYIQHATVSERFPPLYHDKNILYSKDSLNKYENPNDKSVRVHNDFRLPKSDLINVDNRSGVLICPNLIDSIDAVMDLYYFFQSSNFLVAIRPHPRDYRFKFKNVNKNKYDDLYKDLNHYKYVICNESGVLLESIYFNNYTYKYLLSDSIDNYGFLKQGLINKEYDNKTDLLGDIKNDVISYDSDKLEYFIGDTNLSDSEILSYLKNEQ